MRNIDFLWARQGDKEKFEFEYTNKQGNRKTHKPNGIQYIDESEGKVLLLFNTGPFEYVIDKMKSLRLRNSEAFLKTIPVKKEVKYENKAYTSNNIYSYYNEIIDYLIGGNIKNNPKDADGLNFSMQSTKEKILSSDAHKFNKAIFKKFMNGNKAERIILNQESKPLMLPFISNQSQKKAVTNALEYDISVIQGPPGTGKTQTILNIICNAIVEDKKVLVVSNNNSAIDNVAEKLDGLEKMFNFSIRLGNKCYTSKLVDNIQEKMKNDLERLKEKRKSSWRKIDLEKLINKINLLELECAELIKYKNQLSELYTQKRHIDKKISTYNADATKIEINKLLVFPSELKREIEFLRNQRTKADTLLNKAYFRVRFSEKRIDTDNYTMYQWRLEQLYAIKMIKYLENKTRKLPEKQEKIGKLYEVYRKESIEQINNKIKNKFQSCENECNDIVQKEKIDNFFSIKQQILNIYPVILTTLDSVVSNVGYSRYDYVIIDEASQANIITAIPTINNAAKIIIVGDTKQLSHIVDKELAIEDEKLMEKYNIDYKYSFSKKNLLESILSVCEPPEVLLKEHYRCDFNIINYCNKKFYNDELEIYSKNSLSESIKIMALNQEKNSDYGLRKNGDGSYFNRIEEVAIKKYIGDNYSDTAIITPYAKQEENLKESITELATTTGTIYKFQGRESKRVILSTVLTHEIEHCKNTNTLGNETINVAVSRAEDEFVLFTHDKFFKEQKHELKDLIEYIETYGNILESNVNSIFSYLYKQIPYFKKTTMYESVWEKSLYDRMLIIMENYPGFSINMKLTVADVAGDKKYLNAHPEHKKFALNKKAHLDFTIVNELTEKPALVIELDGESHKEPEQQRRDRIKEQILEHHEIPLWRISSKDALEHENLEMVFSEYMGEAEFENKFSSFLEDNKWKY
ncbi:DUF2726 domain-containing protein [Listeria booriae]|uniref:AAA domain-containing protein n=1 Tax=Listeria booriae TaxID=1552123 RepID=UPI0016235986|nr:AAA domain-containing protein [Listeria booriae]MBC2077879.1 DUF2726 domain-containing protein [Listeria booriae]